MYWELSCPPLHSFNWCCWMLFACRAEEGTMCEMNVNYACDECELCVWWTSVSWCDKILYFSDSNQIWFTHLLTCTHLANRFFLSFKQFITLCFVGLFTWFMHCVSFLMLDCFSSFKWLLSSAALRQGPSFLFYYVFPYAWSVFSLSLSPCDFKPPPDPPLQPKCCKLSLNFKEKKRLWDTVIHFFVL